MRQKTVITKLLQSMIEVDGKVYQVLQSVTDCYYKVCEVLQSVTVVTKREVTHFQGQRLTIASGKLHSLDINHLASTIFDPKVTGNFYWDYVNVIVKKKYLDPILQAGLYRNSSKQVPFTISNILHFIFLMSNFLSIFYHFNKF